MELITIPTEHKDHFKTIDTRIFEDPTISCVAKSLLAHMLGRPKGWELRMSTLRKIFKEGRNAINRGFRELRAAGYTMQFVHREQGQMRYVLVVYELPPPPDVRQQALEGFLKTGLELPPKPAQYSPNPRFSREMADDRKTDIGKPVSLIYRNEESGI